MMLGNWSADTHGKYSEEARVADIAALSSDA